MVTIQTDKITDVHRVIDFIQLLNHNNHPKVGRYDLNNIQDENQVIKVEHGHPSSSWSKRKSANVS